MIRCHGEGKGKILNKFKRSHKKCGPPRRIIKEIQHGSDYSDKEVIEDDDICKMEGKEHEVDSYQGQLLTLVCQGGCLIIEKAVFTCSPDQMEDVEEHTAFAKKLCDGKTTNCTLTACPSFWNKQKMDCPDPIQTVVYR